MGIPVVGIQLQKVQIGYLDTHMIKNFVIDTIDVYYYYFLLLLTVQNSSFSFRDKTEQLMEITEEKKQEILKKENAK